MSNGPVSLPKKSYFICTTYCFALKTFIILSNSLCTKDVLGNKPKGKGKVCRTKGEREKELGPQVNQNISSTHFLGKMKSMQ